MLNKEDGFSTPLAMVLVFSLCLIVSSYFLLLVAKDKKLYSYKRYYLALHNSEVLLNDLERDFQNLIYSVTDSIYSLQLNFIYEKYNDYHIKVRDVSTGINKEFLSEKILKNKAFSENKLKNVNQVNYGWFSLKNSNEDTLKMVKNDFNGYNFPFLINQLPMYNCYNMSKEFIEAVLEYNDIKNAKEKAILLRAELETREINKKDLCQILNVTESNSVFSFLGIKTNFWEINMETNDCFIYAVIAGFPSTEDLYKIGAYFIIENRITYKGGVN